MVGRVVKQIINSALRPLGVEVRRISGQPASPDQRQVLDLLQHIQQIGFAPRSVIDVGAAYGAFTRDCARVFPAAQYVLIEPLVEYRVSLEHTLQAVGQGTLIQAAATCEGDGTMEFHVHRDLVGSSLYVEQEDTDVNGVPRSVPTVRLDTVATQLQLHGPVLLKVDVQGAELDALSGAGTLLADVEYVLIEVSLFGFFRGGPQICDVIAFMAARGFVPYDVYNPLFRPLDCALAQIDIAFVKAEGLFRREHAFATREQRVQQDRQFVVSTGSHTGPPP